MSESVKSFRNLDIQLADCMQQDRHRLQRQLRDRQRGRAGKEEQGRREARVQALATAITRSCALRERRQKTLPPVIYPAGLPVSARVEDLKQAIAGHQVVIAAG